MFELHKFQFWKKFFDTLILYGDLISSLFQWKWVIHIYIFKPFWCFVCKINNLNYYTGLLQEFQWSNKCISIFHDVNRLHIWTKENFFKKETTVLWLNCINFNFEKNFWYINSLLRFNLKSLSMKMGIHAYIFKPFWCFVCKINNLNYYSELLQEFQ